MVQLARVERIEKRLLRRDLPDEARGLARVRRTVEAFGLGEGVITHAGGLTGIGPV